MKNRSSVVRKLTPILLALFICQNSFSQDTTGFLCDMDSINQKLLDHKFFVFGEMHFNQVETSFHQLKLTEVLVRRGIKEMNVYLEIPPSDLFYVNKYHQTGDKTWLKAVSLRLNCFEYLKGLNQFKDKLKINFVAIDVENSKDIKLVRMFKYDLLNSIPDSQIFPHLSKMLSLNSRKAIEKEARLIVKDSLLKFQYKAVLDSNDFLLFYEEMNLLSKYGFMRRLASRKNGALRDKHIAEILEESYVSRIPNVLTIGRAHITPKNKETTADLFSYMKKLSRKDFIVMPITYRHDFWLIYNKKSYPREASFSSLINDGIFDLILMPCDRMARYIEVNPE